DRAAPQKAARGVAAPALVELREALVDLEALDGVGRLARFRQELVDDLARAVPRDRRAVRRDRREHALACCHRLLRGRRCPLEIPGSCELGRGGEPEPRGFDAARLARALFAPRRAIRRELWREPLVDLAQRDVAGPRTERGLEERRARARVAVGQEERLAH